jgi:hypothetical protein
VTELTRKRSCVKSIKEESDCEIVQIVERRTQKSKFTEPPSNTALLPNKKRAAITRPLHLIGMDTGASKRLKMNIQGTVYMATADGELVFMLPFIQDAEGSISEYQRTDIILKDFESTGNRLSKDHAYYTFL